MAKTEDQNAKLADYEALPLPISISALVERRLAGLSEHAHRLLNVASVIGRAVPLGLLQAATNQRPEYVTEGLAELVARQFLEEEELGDLAFAHDKVREASYNLISGRQRRKLHLAVAMGLEATDLGGVIGHHWEQAGDNDKAKTCYLAGARAAKERFANEESRAALSGVSGVDWGTDCGEHRGP